VDSDGLPAGPGKVGRLVVTDLNNRAFPLLRYETGDLAVASGGRHGGWQLVERIEGRSSEVLHLPDGRILSAVSLGQLLFVENDFTHLVRAFRCAQVVPGRLELRVNWTRPPHRAERCSMAEVVSTAFGVDAVVVDGSNEGRPRREKAWVVRSEL
jgi:hypothetical protein